MIKKVKDQTGKELTNADVDIILMKKEVSKIMKSTHATSCTPKDCQCGVDVIEYQLIAFITNALNQQREEATKEERKRIYESFHKEVNQYFIDPLFPNLKVAITEILFKVMPETRRVGKLEKENRT